MEWLTTEQKVAKWLAPFNLSPADWHWFRDVFYTYIRRNDEMPACVPLAAKAINQGLRPEPLSAESLKAWRSQYNITQRKAAAALGIDTKSYGLMECGIKPVAPFMSLLTAVADVKKIETKEDVYERRRAEFAAQFKDIVREGGWMPLEIKMIGSSNGNPLITTPIGKTICFYFKEKFYKTSMSEIYEQLSRAARGKSRKFSHRAIRDKDGLVIGVKYTRLA